MIKKLLLIMVLAGMLACAGPVNALVLGLVPGRRNLDVESDTDRPDPGENPGGDSDQAVREFLVKAKPNPKPLVPVPAAPQPKPQPRPRATPAPKTPPPPPPTPKPTPPVTQPS